MLAFPLHHLLRALPPTSLAPVPPCPPNRPSLKSRLRHPAHFHVYSLQVGVAWSVGEDVQYELCRDYDDDGFLAHVRYNTAVREGSVASGSAARRREARGAPPP